MARRPLEAEQCALIVVDMQEKVAAADLGKRTAGAQCPAADSPGWNSEDAGAGDDAIREGLGQHRAGDCILVAGQSADRQADVLLLWQRCVLLIAEALTGPADDRCCAAWKRTSA
jgi:hypothetical protein